MTRKLALCGFVLCLVLWVGCNNASTPESSYSSPVSKAEAVVNGQMISSAMGKATSWHMTMKSGTTDMSMDVVCPDKTRMQTKTGNMTVESVRIGSDMYTKMGAKWMKVPMAANAASVCRGASASASGGAASRVSTFDPNLKITKVGTDTVNGESCTVWEQTWTDAKGAQHKFSICVGSDNLPRKVTTGDAVMTYTDWNKPITIEAPKI